MSLDTIRPWRTIKRRKTETLSIGKIHIGSDEQAEQDTATRGIIVQTLLHENLCDTATAKSQLDACIDIGADIVGGMCHTPDHAHALATLQKDVDIPLVAHIGEDTTPAYVAMESGIPAIVLEPDFTPNINDIIAVANTHNTVMYLQFDTERLHIHSADAMCKHLTDTVQNLQSQGLQRFIVCLRASQAFLMYDTYMQYAFSCTHPIHLDIIPTGNMMEGAIQGALILGNLLWLGIGDSIRVSLNADPMDEIKTAYAILKSLGLRYRGVNVISCPSCARQAFDVVKTVTILEERLEHISTPLTLSVLGCIVNGIGEAQHTDIGFIGGGKNTHQVYMNGIPSHRLKDEDLINHIVGLVEQKAHEIETAKIESS